MVTSGSKVIEQIDFPIILFVSCGPAVCVAICLHVSSQWLQTSGYRGEHGEVEEDGNSEKLEVISLQWVCSKWAVMKTKTKRRKLYMNWMKENWIKKN